MRSFEVEHRPAGLQHVMRTGGSGELDEGLPAESRSGPAHDSWDPVALDVPDQEVRSGGQLRDGFGSLRRNASIQPLADGLSRHAEEVCRFRLVQAPHGQYAVKRPSGTSPIEGFSELVEPLRPLSMGF
jgi:hypothetical protein